jgi:hypothetical protein
MNGLKSSTGGPPNRDSLRHFIKLARQAKATMIVPHLHGNAGAGRAPDKNAKTKPKDKSSAAGVQVTARDQGQRGQNAGRGIDGSWPPGNSISAVR